MRFMLEKTILRGDDNHCQNLSCFWADMPATAQVYGLIVLYLHWSSCVALASPNDDRSSNARLAACFQVPDAISKPIKYEYEPL